MEVGNKQGEVAAEEEVAKVAGGVLPAVEGEDVYDGEEEEEEVKWAKHYSSGQEILLVGEGDFSFSLSLATTFRSAASIVATSLDSYGDVTRKYNKARSNLGALKKMGATLLHGVDATTMKHHTDLKMRRFDRVIFNFPHAGFKGKEDDIRLIKNASRMLRQDGEIHINHKTTSPFNYWNLEALASKNSLVLFKFADFKIADYPGYNNKRGDGQRCDQPFPLGECSTFMFKIGRPLRGKRVAPNVPHPCRMLSSSGLPERNPNRDSYPIAYDGYPLIGTQGTQVAGYNRYVSGWPNVESFPRVCLPHSMTQQLGSVSGLGERTGSPRMVIDSLLPEICMDYMMDAHRMHGSISPEFSSTVEGFLRTSRDMYMDEAPGRTIHGYIAHLQELHHRSSVLRTASLRRLLLWQTFDMGGALQSREPQLPAASVWC